MSIALNPLALVSTVFKQKLSVAVPQAIFDLTLIGTVIGPSVDALALQPIMLKLSFIHDTIRPLKFPLSVKHAVQELSFIGVSIFELNLTRAAQALAIELTLSTGGLQLTLPVRIQHFREFNREHHP